MRAVGAALNIIINDACASVDCVSDLYQIALDVTIRPEIMAAATMINSAYNMM